MKRFTLLALAALLTAGTASAAELKGDVAKGKEIATNICAACHAADGNSGIAMYPKLSAQFSNYIFHQTKDIKDGKRTTGAAVSMAPMVMGLSDQDIADVAAYYEKQFPKQGETNPKANPELGAQIFRGGLADKKVPACMACHGPSGAGIPGGGPDIVAYPRLGGQHAAYITEQLNAYKSGQRENEIMADIAKRMSDEDISAVANFIQGLH